MRTLSHLWAEFVGFGRLNAERPRAAKPEQEKALLSMLINKLGDSSSKATCG